MRNYDEYEDTYNPSVYKKARKKHLANRGDISCPICPYNRGENKGRKARVKEKSFNRDTIRRLNYYDDNETEEAYEDMY